MKEGRKANAKKETLIRVHLMLDRSDYARFQEVWGDDPGASAAIRIAMKRLLMDHEARTRRIIDETEPNK